MYCSNCGKQLPDHARFCDSCGAPQNPIPYQQPVNPVRPPVQTPPPAQQPKKKGSPLLGIVAALLAFLVAKFVIAPAIVSDPEPPAETTPPIQITTEAAEATEATEAPIEIANPAYTAIFDDTYIIHFQTFFNLDMQSFAMKQEDGMILCADYGYKDDMVYQWVETIYIPVAEYTDDQKAEVENTMRSQLAEIDAMNCCVISYNMSENYLTITCTYTDVNLPENYTELYNAGVMQTNTFISMSATAESLLNQGFVQK